MSQTLNTTKETTNPKNTPSKVRDANNSIPSQVIVLDSDVVSFETVIIGLCRIIPGMTKEKATNHAFEVHTTGQSVVWEGDLELAEAYCKRLNMEGMDATIN